MQELDQQMDGNGGEEQGQRKQVSRAKKGEKKEDSDSKNGEEAHDESFVQEEEQE